MAGSPTYTADPVLDSVSGESLILPGNINVSAGSTSVIGNGTFFTEDLEIGDKIEVNNVNGTAVSAVVKEIVNDSNLITESAFDGANAVSAGVLKRVRAKLQGSDKKFYGPNK